MSPWKAAEAARGHLRGEHGRRGAWTRTGSSRRSAISEYRINQQIRADTVRLIGADGVQLGIIPCEDALKQALEQELDLVQVAPQADPPVCKLLDYGKFKYRQKKRRQSQKHHRSRLKGMRIGFASDDHDLAFKAARVREFLTEHDKV